MADGGTSILPHPHRVRPLGSRLLDSGVSLREVPGALGMLGNLSDELLVAILGLLSAAELAHCAGTSRAMRVLALFEDLWRARVLEEIPDNERLQYHPRGWHCTYLARQHRMRHDASREKGTPFLATIAPPELCYYSDVLFAPWQCGTASIPPRWSRHQSITRLSSAELSVADFASRFEAPGVPVILTGVVNSWPAFSKWSESQLRARFGDRAGFHVGGHTMDLDAFWDYCASNHDEQPLYLFDKRFGETSAQAVHGQGSDAGDGSDGGLAADYTVPVYFEEGRDLFASLAPPHRPDHRWLIAGGTRSGSSWHVDPNATSAWNACVSGRKKWILCPPGKPPPGVNASSDGITVTSPISLYEWFRVFYSSLAELRREAESGEVVALEATVEAGELLFVPAGWWHCCLNLEPSIAITQNYAPASSARRILRYFRSGGAEGLHVSGIPLSARATMADAFERVLEAHCPEALGPEDDQERSATEGAKMLATHAVEATLGLMGTPEEQGTGFSFGFG
jgi:hypothetical protein